MNENLPGKIPNSSNLDYNLSIFFVYLVHWSFKTKVCWKFTEGVRINPVFSIFNYFFNQGLYSHTESLLVSLYNELFSKYIGNSRTFPTHWNRGYAYWSRQNQDIYTYLGIF